MNVTNTSSLHQISARVNKTLSDGIQLDLSTEESKKLLIRRMNSKINLTIMFVDINGSTEMSFSLANDKFARMVQTFAQEISILVAGYGGYVFKYEGDAVISLFPAEYDQAKACKNALDCSKAVLKIIKDIINPAFRTNALPEITVRIGLAYGDALVVLYGKNLRTSHIDIIGSSISMASKIVSIAKADQILIGEHVYNSLMSSGVKDTLYDSTIFREVNLDPKKWKYPSRYKTGNPYRVYEFLKSC
jgi:adenylate cyclase